MRQAKSLIAALALIDIVESDGLVLAMCKLDIADITRTLISLDHGSARDDNLVAIGLVNIALAKFGEEPVDTLVSVRHRQSNIKDKEFRTLLDVARFMEILIPNPADDHIRTMRVSATLDGIQVTGVAGMELDNWGYRRNIEWIAEYDYARRLRHADSVCMTSDIRSLIPEELT